MVSTRTKCRICGEARLTLFLDLGAQPLANAFLTEVDLARPEPRYPLRVFFCENCGLSQLGEVVSPETLFREYVYFSSVMPSAHHFNAYAEEVRSRFLRGPRDFIVEIGSNDGHLLKPFKEAGVRVLGVDPAENIAAIARGQGVETIANFFSEKLARDIRSQYGAAEVILANNVVAHIDDHHDLMRGVCELLASHGVFIFEAPHVLDMIEHHAFDGIYHEHLSYLSLRPLTLLFRKFDMEIFDVRILPVQGNYSLRAYACRNGARVISSSVGALLAQEETSGLGRRTIYEGLARKIVQLKEEVTGTLAGLKRNGKRLAAYGAPARGNTLLNYFGISRDLLEYATEELPSKIGRYTPGTHIPVIDIREARNDPPDYYLLLAWPYRDVILEKERTFRAKGGKFIIPVGNVRII